MRPSALIVLMCALAALAAAPADAKKKKRHPKPPSTQLISKSRRGGFPNGPSQNGVFAQNRQLATRVAFDSSASNLVKGDRNGLTDVFLVRRAKPYDRDAPPWRAGKTRLVSKGLGGAPANGPSYKPDLDGEQLHGPRCVAFVSEASNLVRGDTNGVADAFVRNLRTGRTRRVSVGADGQQANGATSEVKVDGHCDRVAFVSGATNLALTQTSRQSWKSAVTTAPPAGTRQVYVRVLDDYRDNAGLSGLTFLASAARSGAAGNDDSYQVAFARSGGGCGRQARCGDFSGEAVVFASRATNLSAADHTSASDVYMRSFNRRFVRIRFSRPTRVDGERVRGTIVGAGPLQMSTRLLSATPGGEVGNGPSDQPSSTDAGHFVAFRTLATNLIRGDTNGQPDVVRKDTASGDVDAVSRTDGGTLGNGPSGEPFIGRTGFDVFFISAATNLDGNDKNCTADAYHYDFPATNQILTGVDSAGAPANAPFGTPDPCPPVIAAPQSRPMGSYYLNYMLFDSSYALLDKRMARKAFHGMDRATAAYASKTDPKMRQVYLRYVSPR